jgi:hypothetical protein
MVQFTGPSLGVIATFRYLSPTATDWQPMIMVLTEQHVDGNMHGLNLRYLRPDQQQQLQHYWYPSGQQQQDHTDPFTQEQIKRYEQQVEQEKRQQELLAQEERGVVMNPEAGATFGGVGTWVKSPANLIQRGLRGVYGALRRQLGGEQPPPEQSSPFANVNRQTVPQIDNPTDFYYRFVKPVLGSDTKNCYRKYKLEYVKDFKVLYEPQRQWQSLSPAQRRWFPRLFGRKREEEE